MNIRPKTVRRLMILVLALALLAGGVVTWVSLSQRRVRAQIAQVRHDAVAAFEAKDYSRAVGLFSEYLTRSHTQDSDAEAVFDYGKSRMNVPLEDNRHVFEAIGVFVRYLQLDPKGDPRGEERRITEEREAGHLLLKLYADAQYNKEARQWATKLLAADPNDVDALRNMIRAQQGDKLIGPALEACRKLNQLVPDDLDWQITELRLMAATKAPPQQILDHARELRERHPDNATFEALFSWANLAYGNDFAAARRAAEAAAKLPPGKPETVLQIVRLLDVQQDFTAADALLARALAAQPHATNLRRTLVQRTWERHSPADVLEKLKDVDPVSADPALAGYKAMALFELGRADDAAPVVRALSDRKDSLQARAWALALQTAYGKDRPAPPVALRRFAEASVQDPSNPVFQLMLGQAYAGIGEVDQAVRSWNEAGQRSASWALPYCLSSRALSASGRYAEAMRAAEVARQRSPGSQFVETTYARAWYGLDVLSGLRTPDAKQLDALFAHVENVQKAWKNEPNTLPIYVSMLARRNQRDVATQQLREVLAEDPAPAVETLVQLSTVSRQEHLGVEDALLDRADKAHGPAAAVAFARAAALKQSGRAKEALEQFDAASRGHDSDLAWQLAGARLHDAAADPDAARRWATLSDNHPDNLQVQHAVLESAAHRTDRDLWRKAIDRLKAITGSEAQLWQVEDARRQLAGEPSEKELAAVVASLQKITAGAPEQPEPHRLLGEALLRVGTPDAAGKATAELSAAHELRPGDFDTTAKLVELLAAQGARDRAAAIVDSVARDPNLSGQRRLWAARSYADLGRVDAAIALLTGEESAGANAESDAARDGLMAQLYRRVGRTAEADALYQKVLENPASTADALAAGAEFYAGVGQAPTADRFVARLESLPLKPGTLDVLRAHVQQILGRTDESIATLAAGTKAHPQVEQLWQELSGAYLCAGKFDEADRAAAEGLAAIPAAPGLAAMRQQVARLRTLPASDVGRLIEGLSHNPRDPVATQVVAMLADAKARNVPADQVLSSLRQLAERNPGFIPLQALAAQRLAAAGRLKEAGDLATRAAATSPDNPELARLACAIHAAAGNWDAARDAGLRWRKLVAAHPLEADLALARCDLQQPKPDAGAAAARLAPYVADGAPEAGRQAALPLYCSSLVAAGKSAQARAILEPMATASQKWRMVWLELAGFQKDAAAAVAWVRTGARFVPDDSAQEKLALAEAWEQVGSRFDSAEAHEAARAILQPIVSGPNVPAGAWPAWAAVNQAADNYTEAERAWREYLRSNPNQPLARNNLAYMLLLQGGQAKLAEAEQLSASAISTEPGVSTLYDTLARVQLRLGKVDEAVKNFRAALNRNPANVDAMIGLADVLQSRPQNREEARALLARIDAAMKDGAAIASPLRKQLDRVKTSLSSSGI